MAEIEDELKSLLMRVKENSEKTHLELIIHKMKNMASGPITSWQIDGETVETVTDYFWGAPKSLQIVTAAIELRHLLFERKVMTNLDSILEKEMATHSSILAWRIPWMEEPGRL